MFGSFKILTVRGIPIRAHFTLLIILPIFALQYSHIIGVSYVWGWVMALGLFASVALHELGHSFVGMAKGIRSIEIVLTPIGGIARLDRIPTRPADEILIAIAGPLVSLVLGLCLCGIMLLLNPQPGDNLGIVIGILGGGNIGLVLFNLIPCFPMDGGRIFRAAMTKRVGRLEATRRAVKLAGWLSAALFVWGFFPFSLLKMIIAWFVYASAQSEYRMVLAQETAHRINPFETIFGAPRQPNGSEVEISVGPPPYRRD